MLIAVAQTFFFYDLETSGLSARSDRVMQFAGIRTDLDLNPIGEPQNVLVKLNDDTLPSPEAVMVTGISPQSTQSDGLTEAEFARYLKDDIFTPETITVGFNNVRFDDEFVRHLFWRTFHDPYDWCWDNGCSRWDMLDVVRMTRALRPSGIKWPVDAEGKPTNRLELITKENGISHTKAHDALSDVEALIDVTRLIRTHQRKLFDYLFSMRLKKAVQGLVSLEQPKPFVYVSGRYDVSYDKATIAFPLTTAPNQNVAVYDLRHDPTPFIGLTVDQLRAKLFAPWEERKTEGFVPLPVKQLQYNRCPAVAPIGVLEEADGWNRIKLSLETIETHKNVIIANPGFAEKIRAVIESRPEYPKSNEAEAQLYDGFIDGPDKLRMETVRNADARELADFHPDFNDPRLSDLLLRYKARNFPASLSEDEARAWELWRGERLKTQVPGFLGSLQKIATTSAGDDQKQFLLQELQLWAESVMPSDFGDE